MYHPDMPIQVCSHKRSGTHLLMATLEKNFELGRPVSGMDYVYGEGYLAEATPHQPPKVFQIDGKVQDVIPWAKLFGSHQPFDSCDIPTEKILYIYRHPWDTLWSLFRFELKGEWLTMGKDGKAGWDSWMTHQAQRWYQHVKGYTESDCLTFRYENIGYGHIDGHSSSIICQRFGLKWRHGTEQRITVNVGWKNPAYVGPKECPEDFKDIALKRIREVVPQGFCGYDI